MTARCTSCSSHFHFRAYRGAKLAHQQCRCGGKYELISFAESMRAEGQRLPEGVEAYNAGGNLWIYPMKNRAGQLFLLATDLKTYKPFTPCQPQNLSGS